MQLRVAIAVAVGAVVVVLVTVVLFSSVVGIVEGCKDALVNNIAFCLL